MKNIVVITARGGEQSYPNKNLVPVLGKPVVAWPIESSLDSHLTDGVFISTNCPRIRSVSERCGATYLDRPEEISTKDSPHKEVIRYSAEKIKELFPEAKNLIILLGNSVHVTAALIDKTFEMLNGGQCDSVMTAYRAGDSHPYRAMALDKAGYVTSFLGVDAGSNRQGYPPVYYYDQGVWGMKIDCAIRQHGPLPWVWLGKDCKLIERHWSDGRDIHGPHDIELAAHYLIHRQHEDHS